MATQSDFATEMVFDSPQGRRHMLLNAKASRKADALAVEKGMDSFTLMENAGLAAADVICQHYPPLKTFIACGPGNNGGDGFIIARHLKERGFDISVGLLSPADQLCEQARQVYALWDGETVPLSGTLPSGTELFIEALFGTGYRLPLSATIVNLLEEVKKAGIKSVGIDMPCGVDMDSGECSDGAIPFNMTITFFRSRPGHYLLPGRVYCGHQICTDIGIEDQIVTQLDSQIYLNHPDLWHHLIPRLDFIKHKYTRGQGVIMGGHEMIGATMLATRAAQRSGAGLITVGSPLKQAPLYRLALESAVVKDVKDTAAFADLLKEQYVSCGLIGPGLGKGTPGAQEKILTLLRCNVPAILDADALSVFEGNRDLLFAAIADSAGCLMTPHEGEFSRLFPDLCAVKNKMERARQAAIRSGAVILLKGADTVIADAHGKFIIIDAQAPADMASAGTGDVLAGLCLGLCAQGMELFAGACAATWINGQAARLQGRGLIASDLPDLVPQVLTELEKASEKSV